MKFEIERDNDEPHIKDMTEKAIQILQKNEKGFFLLVEGKLNASLYFKDSLRNTWTNIIPHVSVYNTILNSICDIQLKSISEQ